MIEKSLEQSINFSWDHRVSESEKILPGFRDGGRNYTLANDGTPWNQPKREILVFHDPKNDPRLQAAINEARAGTAHCSTRLEVARKIGAFVDYLLPENDPDQSEAVLKKISGGRIGAEISLGKLIEAGIGTCRHRSLLFKVINDALEIPTALVRGIYASGSHRGSHTWNEVVLEDGERRIFDVMGRFHIAVDEPRAALYHDVRDKPIYATGHACGATQKASELYHEASTGAPRPGSSSRPSATQRLNS